MSRYIGDFSPGVVVRFRFAMLSQALVPTTPTVNPAFAVYKNSTTESTAGITVTVDFDGKAGLILVAIDTSADTSFYVAGEDYDVVFTAGTVDGKDLTRVPVRTFSLENRSRKANVVQIAGQTANAAAAVTFPASVANESTVAARATQTSVDAKPTLVQIEASTALAKEATLTQIDNDVQAVKDDTSALIISVAAVLARIGGFTGTGVNTILGFFRALMRKDASITTPSDVGGAFVHTTDSLEAIRDRGDAAWTTGAGGGGGGGDPWATDLPAGNYTANQAGAIVQAIAAKTSTINSGKVSYAGPVTAKGRIDQVVIGDDYLTAHGTAFVWTIDAIAGMSAAAVTVHFGGKCGSNTFLRTGTATDIGAGKWSLVVEMPRADSGNLIAGEYIYSVEVRNAAGVELTRIYYDEPFVAVEKFT